jgi:hypothetical protein
MNTKHARRYLIFGFFILFSFLLINQPFVVNEGRAQAKVKIAVLDKVPKAQSALRFKDLYPELSRQLRDAFEEDGRFDVLSTSAVDRAIRKAGLQKEKIDPDNVEQLRKIGKNAGADVVFGSYFYEMGGHAMPMHGNNVFVLAWVETSSVVKLDKEYGRAIPADYLVSSDANSFKELLSKAGSLLPPR